MRKLGKTQTVFSSYSDIWEFFKDMKPFASLITNLFFINSFQVLLKVDFCSVDLDLSWSPPMSLSLLPILFI